MTRSPGWLPVATGVTTLLLALWVAFTFITPEPEPTSAAEAAEVVPAPTIASTTTSVSSTSAVASVVITTPPPEIEGVSESIARVLSSSGFASELSFDDVAGEIPPSVLRTLIANGVVLTIATEEAKP